MRLPLARVNPAMVESLLTGCGQFMRIPAVDRAADRDRNSPKPLRRQLIGNCRVRQSNNAR